MAKPCTYTMTSHDANHLVTSPVVLRSLRSALIAGCLLAVTAQLCWHDNWVPIRKPSNESCDKSTHFDWLLLATSCKVSTGFNQVADEMLIGCRGVFPQAIKKQLGCKQLKLLASCALTWQTGWLMGHTLHSNTRGQNVPDCCCLTHGRYWHSPFWQDGGDIYMVALSAFSSPLLLYSLNWWYDGVCMLPWRGSGL